MKNTNKIKQVSVTIGSICLLGLALLGCARTVNDIEATNKASFSKESSYIKAIKGSNEAKNLAQRKIKANFIDSSVYYAVSQIAKAEGIPFDKGFRPASDYKVTMNYKGTLGGFLDLIYNETGIQYRYRNGLLSVFNKKDVEQGYKPRGCGKGSRRINIALNDVEPSQVFKHFSKKYGFNFSFQTRFYNLGTSNGNKEAMRNVSFYYKGCDRMDALRRFIRANDLTMKITSKNNVQVMDYVIAELDLPTYYNIDFSSSDGGIGDGGEGGSGTGGSSISTKENFKEEFMAYIKQYLTPGKGQVYPSGRGYLTIMDKPSVVREVRKLVRTERRRQGAIDLSVSIIRVDTKDELSMGVDWNKALTSIADKWGFQTLVASVNSADKVGGGLSIGGTKDGLSQLVKALQTYGNTKIVRDYHIKTRSGILSTFKAVDQIPYITTSVVTSNGTSEISTEAKIAEAGLVINIIPTLSSKGEIVNLATNIKVSEYQGDKIFNVNGDEFKLPKISSNTLDMPARVHMNESVILTGLKLKKGSMSKEGVPGLSQAGGLMGGLFGYNQQDVGVAEFLIVVTPKSVVRY